MKQQIYNTALYLRLSRDDELQGESSALPHKEVCCVYMQRHHLNVIDEYIDDGWSGTNFGQDRVFQELNRGYRGKENRNCVVTKDLSRLWQKFIL